MFRIIKFIIFVMFSSAVLFAQETTAQWVDMRFSWPTIDFTFSIQSGNAPRYNASKHGTEYKHTYSCFTVNGSDIENWFMGACTAGTYNFAAKISAANKTKSVESTDKVSISNTSPIKESIFTFSVYADKSKPEAISREGYLSKEDFKSLLEMLHSDVAETNKQKKNLNTDSITFEEFLKEILKKL